MVGSCGEYHHGSATTNQISFLCCSVHKGVKISVSTTHNESLCMCANFISSLVTLLGVEGADGAKGTSMGKGSCCTENDKKDCNGG